MPFVNISPSGSTSAANTATSLDFSTSTGFSFSSSLIGFTAGTTQLKNQYGPDVVFAAKFSSSTNGDYSRDGGSLTGTKTGAVTITAGKLDLTTDTNYKELSFNPFKNLPFNSTWTVRMRMTPNWSGSPSTRPAGE